MAKKTMVLFVGALCLMPAAGRASGAAGQLDSAAAIAPLSAEAGAAAFGGIYDRSRSGESFASVSAPAPSAPRPSLAPSGSRLTHSAAQGPVKGGGDDPNRSYRRRSFWQFLAFTSALFLGGTALAVGGLMTGGAIPIMAGLLGGVVGICGALGLYEAIRQGPDNFSF